MKDKQLRKLVNQVQDKFSIDIRKVFLDEVDDPIPILRIMVNTAMNWYSKEYDCWSIGKSLQFKQEYIRKIPLKTEYEVSAGLWYLIHEGKV